MQIDISKIYIQNLTSQHTLSAPISIITYSHKYSNYGQHLNHTALEHHQPTRWIYLANFATTARTIYIAGTYRHFQF